MFVQIICIRICKSARKYPEPYDVACFLKSFKNFCKSFRPGRGKCDAKVTDISAIKYWTKAEIYYKIKFSDNWYVLAQRIYRLSLGQFSSSLHTEKCKINLQKFEDLLNLKNSLPKDYFQFTIQYNIWRYCFY